MVMKNNTLDGYIKTSEIGEKQVEHIDEPIQKQGKTPEIRYPEYTEEWQKYKIKDIANNFDKQRVPITANLRISGSTPYYGANGIQDHVEGFTHDGEFVLVAEDGASDLINYPVQYVKGKIWVNNHAHVLQGKSEICNTNFLSFCINQAEIRPYLVGGGRSKLNAEVMMGINLNIPSLPEQQQVGQFFKKIDQQITAQQEKIQHHKQQKKALLQQMFPQGDSSMPSVRCPGYDDEWSECKLNNILTLLKDGTHETHKDSSEGCLLLSAKNIKNGKIFWNKTDRIISIEDYNKIHKNFKLQQGDVLLTIVGSIGETAILKNPENITFQRSVAYLRPDKSKLTAEYLNIVIQTRQFQNELDKRKAISAQPGIYLKDLRKIRVKIPSLPEQQQIGQFFQKIDQQIQLNQNKLEDMKQMKKGLMQRMFV